MFLRHTMIHATAIAGISGVMYLCGAEVASSVFFYIGGVIGASVCFYTDFH